MDAISVAIAAASLAISILGFIVNWFRSRYLFRIKEYPFLSVSLISPIGDGTILLKVYNETNVNAILVEHKVKISLKSETRSFGSKKETVAPLKSQKIEFSSILDELLLSVYPSELRHEDANIYSNRQRVMADKEIIFSVRIEIESAWKPPLYRRSSIKHNTIMNIVPEFSKIDYLVNKTGPLTELYISRWKQI